MGSGASKEEVKSLQDYKAWAETELESKDEEINNLTKKLGEANGELEDTQIRLDSATTKNKSYSNQITDMQAMINEKNIQLSDNTIKMEKYAKEVEELQTKIQQHKDINKTVLEIFGEVYPLVNETCIPQLKNLTTIPIVEDNAEVNGMASSLSTTDCTIEYYETLLEICDQVSIRIEKVSKPLELKERPEDFNSDIDVNDAIKEYNEQISKIGFKYDVEHYKDNIQRVKDLMAKHFDAAIAATSSKSDMMKGKTFSIKTTKSKSAQLPLDSLGFIYATWLNGMNGYLAYLNEMGTYIVNFISNNIMGLAFFVGLLLNDWDETNKKMQESIDNMKSQESFKGFLRQKKTGPLSIVFVLLIGICIGYYLCLTLTCNRCCQTPCCRSSGGWRDVF